MGERGYQRFLPDLGFSSLDQFLGRTVEEVIPNTQMRRVLETGQPVLIDLLTNRRAPLWSAAFRCATRQTA